MELILYYFVEANLYLISLYLVYRGFIQSAKNYKVGRPFLIVGIFVSLLLPLLSLSGLQLVGNELNLSTALSEITISASNAATVASFVFTPLFIVKVIYSLGVVLLASKLVMDLYQLIRVKTTATIKDNHFELSQSNAAFSFMNWIFIGSNYSPEEKAVLLRHEEVHVNKKHSLDILLCQALKITFWMNPLVYRFKKLFQEIHEYEADELSWQERDSYLELLIQQNFNSFPSISNQFKSTHLKLRIMRLKNQFTRKITPAKIGLSVALFATTLFINQNLKAVPNASGTKQVAQATNEKTAQFPGGQEAMMKFISGHLIYPKTMKEQGIAGKVILQFKVLTDGSLSDFKALKSPHEDFTNAAIKAMKQMPKWKPAEKDGEKVNTILSLPIKFDMPEPPTPPTPPTPPSPAK